MNVTITEEGNKALVSLEGRLDTLTAPQLEAEVNGKLDGVKTLIFDFQNLAYVSSAGLRILFMAQKIMNKQGKMIVRNANADIKDIFTVTGFSNILTIE